MKKACFRKIILILCVFVFVIVVGGWLGHNLYFYYKPPIEIVSIEIEDENLYFNTPSYGIEYKSVFGVSPTITKQLEEFATETERVFVDLHTFSAPMNVNAGVEIVNGQTVVTYVGTATDAEGKTVEINERLVFDFVLTEDIKM